MATTKKASTLAAVNTVISNVGQAPVTSLESGNPLVEMAEQILHEVSRAVQAEGWIFNTEYCYPFPLDGSGNIEIPTDILSLDTSPRSDTNVIIRRGKLYNKTKHTYTFTEDQELDVVWLFDFEDLPEAFKNYITVRAANLFAGRAVGSQEAVRFGEREELLARATVLEYDTNQGDYTIFSDRDNGNTYDSYRPIDTLLRY
tara:strand:+ start:19713 stop:20315 length:603 start_codon:yes stop_codon:yes gene_type:complete